MRDKFEEEVVAEGVKANWPPGQPLSQQSLTRRWVCSGDAARPDCLARTGCCCCRRRRLLLPAIPHEVVGERVGEVHLRVRGRRWGRGICGGGGDGGGAVATSGGRQGRGGGGR